MNSLRSRLIGSHVAVIALAFVLLTVAAAVPVRRAQLRAEQTRILSVAGAVALQTAIVARLTGSDSGATVLQALLEREAQRSRTRLLLVSSDGLVIHDSWAGAIDSGARPPGLAARIAALRARVDAGGGRALALALGDSIGRLDGRLAALATTTNSTTAGSETLYVVAISPGRHVPVLAGVLRPLVYAGALALTVGIVASVLLARSIARPLARLTQAASAISAGNVDARLPGAGDDELGRLVHAFNAMLERLAATYAAQRTLLGNIAHELRTPLTSIQGYAQALRDGAADSPAARATALAVIGEETQRMADLVNQILQLSRLESGQVALQRAPVALAPLLQRLQRVLAPQASAAGVTVTTAVPTDLVVHGDAELLTQALGNLVANAVRHTPAGGAVTLTATRVVAESAAACARVVVRDTGTGIAADELEHIFERFQRGGDNADAARAAPRFGLGLAIARAIVQQHGGTLSVSSAPGTGTAFTFDLPLTTAEPLDD